MKIITGMHRSGTSLVARLFYEAGADMGDQDTFYRPDKWNPDGYFEQPDILSINMSLINGPLWKFSYFRLPSTNTIIKRADKKSKSIHDTAHRYNKKIIKETRFCLTIPAWQKHGAKIDKIIICLRDPYEVARSLKRRNKITMNMAYSLWLIHNQRLLDNSKEIPVLFLYYANIVSRKHFQSEMCHAFKFFDIDISKKTLAQMSSTIIFKKAPAVQKQSEYPEPVKKLWEELLIRHSNQFKSSKSI